MLCANDYYIVPQDHGALFTSNQLKLKSAGRPVVMLPLILFSDNTSGNKSKKWHKFDSWSALFAGLPNEENAELESIRFVGCSDKVTVLDMAVPLSDELKDLELNGIEAYDALLRKSVLVVCPLICIIADNPRASELLNHLGSSARNCCRMCMASS